MKFSESLEPVAVVVAVVMIIAFPLALDYVFAKQVCSSPEWAGGRVGFTCPTN